MDPLSWAAVIGLVREGIGAYNDVLALGERALAEGRTALTDEERSEASAKLEAARAGFLAAFAAREDIQQP